MEPICPSLSTLMALPAWPGITLLPAWPGITLLPALLMTLAALLVCLMPGTAWRTVMRCSGFATLAALLHLGAALGGADQASALAWPGVRPDLPAAWVAALVQILGTLVASFSSRYLQGEPWQARYAAALCGVLAAVQVLVVADHWLLLIGAWAVIGVALETLLRHYDERPFARLAAHKKRVADRLADLLLLGSAALAWHTTGSGLVSKAVLAAQDAAAAGSLPWTLQASAILLALAVMVRTALLPMHGWLIQVMEAPTPVSALLHAGVINLGGYILIRSAPLIDASPAACTLLVAGGLLGALLAGFVGLTRVSIKVRLAWSTVSQMGFMVMECGLGLHTLALLHLIGHSLYKAQAFLAASGVVRETRRQMLLHAASPLLRSLVTAPLGAAMAVGGVQAVAVFAGLALWPSWWSAVLALAWAPAFWRPAGHPTSAVRLVAAMGGTAALALAAVAGHALPLGVKDTVAIHGALRLVQAQFVLAGMALMYAGLAAVQSGTPRLEVLRRWSYAGFYIDEIYTRLTLRLWPGQWGAPAAARNAFAWRASPAPSLSTTGDLACRST